MMLKSKLFFIVAIIMLFTQPVLAETKNSGNEGMEKQDNETFQLETITVIATKTPKAPLDSPASVSVIPEVVIEAFNSEHPFKPLALSEGIWPRQYRGLADYWARPLIRGQRALIQVDGVDWHDYGYYSDTAAIPMKDVERIDVVRGPFSALYGSLALTGVINYTTKIPRDLEIDASASYGTWDTRYYSFRIGDRPFTSDDGFFYSFSFKSRTTDGYITTPSYRSLSTPISGELDPDTPIVTGWIKDIDPQTGSERYMIGNQGKNWYEDYAMFLKTGYDFSADTRLWYSLNISEFEYGWKDGRSYLCDDSGTTIYEDSVYVQDQGNTYSISLNPLLFSSDRKIKESAIHTVNFTHSIPDFLDITAILAYNDKESATHYIGNSRYKVEDNSLTQADITATYHGPDDTYLITMGIQGVSEEATVTTNNLSDPYNENSIVSIYERTSGENLTLGYFAQLEYTPIEYLTAYLGGRYDKWWGEDADYANIDGDNIKYPDMSDSQFSPKASLVYRPMENGVIRASYGKSFMAPSLYYRTASYYWEGGGTISMADPNPDLGPTTNQSWEIGTEWEFMDKRLRVKATYFENDFEDLVVNQTTTYTLTDGTEVTQKMRVNAEDAEADGIETSIEALLPYNMKAGLFYSHVWSEYTKTQAASKLGWELDETPTDMWSIWIGYFGRKLDMSISYRYSDSRYDDNYAPYADTSYKGDDEYHVVDAKVSYRPAEHVTLSLSVDNLFDEEYYEYYLAPGRTCLGTASFSF